VTDGNRVGSPAALPITLGEARSSVPSARWLLFAFGFAQKERPPADLPEFA